MSDDKKNNKTVEPKKVIPLLPEGIFYKGKAKDYPGIKNIIKDKYKKSKGGSLKGNQTKLDMNKDGKISGEDFKMMKKSEGGLIRGTGAAVRGTNFKGVF